MKGNPDAWGNAFTKVGKAPGGLGKLKGMAGTAQTMLPKVPGIRAGQDRGAGGTVRPFGSTDNLAFDRFDPEEPRDKGGEWTDSGASAEPLKGSSGHPMLVSTRNVTAKKAEENSAESYTRPDLEALHRFPEQEKAVAKLFANGKNYPGLRAGETGIRAAVDRMKDNLRALYNDATPADRKLWA